jgi:hypothetical protein
MKTTKTVLAFVLLLMGVLAAEPAFAWGHSRVRVGVFIGAPLIGFGYPYYYPPYGYAPYYYPPYSYAPYYYPPYYPAPVVVQQQPTVYVEQPGQPAASQPQSQGYWYYCADSRAYYPYVKECPAGWQRVAPQPG